MRSRKRKERITVKRTSKGAFILLLLTFLVTPFRSAFATGTDDLVTG